MSEIHEMKTLTLKGEEFNSFPDQQAREAVLKKLPLPEGAAQVGQYLRVLSVDGLGQIVELEPADVPTGDGTVTVNVEPAEDDVPILFFSAPLQQTKDEIVCRFWYYSKTKTITGWAKIKAQGTSSMGYAKKNQTATLYADEACTQKLKINFKGWGAQSKFCLKANWIDISHARNIVSARLWGDIVKSRPDYADLPEELRTSPNQGAVDGFPVLVYAAGIYQGRYTLNIPKDAWMANMDDDLDEHCILCGENYVSGCFRAAANINGSDWSDEVHDTVPDSIKTRWNECIDFVRNSTDEEFYANLHKYFNVPSLIDYDLYGLYNCGLDAFGKNQTYLTYNGGYPWIANKYDMDSTWLLYWNGSKFVASDYGRGEYEDMISGREGNLLYIRLEQLFWKELQERLPVLLDGPLSIANIDRRFEEFIRIVPPHIVAEDYASTTGEGKFAGIPSKTTNNIQQLRAAALARRQWTIDYVAALTPANPVPCEGITLDKNTLTFTAEGTQTVTATIVPDGCTDNMVWVSSNPEIASISVDGYVCAVEAIANGNATITATCGEYSASCSVAVSGLVEPVPCTGITLDKTSLTFNSEESQTITATVTPSDTTDRVVWDIDNEGVATVENGVVTPVADGSATITATCGSQSASCAVTVSGVYDASVLFSLDEETVFDGSSTYIDTGVQLYDEAKDFTVFIDFATAAEVTARCSVLHCMNEVAGYPGFCLDADVFKYYYIDGTAVSGKAFRPIHPGAREYLILRNDINTKKETLYIGALRYNRSFSNINVITQNLLVGCYQAADGTKGRYWNGTVYNMKVWNRALTDEEMESLIGVETTARDIVWSDTAEYRIDSTTGAVTSGNDWVTPDLIEAVGGTEVALYCKNSDTHTFLAIAQYDENSAFIKKTVMNSPANGPVSVLLESNTKYIRCVAYGSTTDPGSHVELVCEVTD